MSNSLSKRPISKVFFYYKLKTIKGLNFQNHWGGSLKTQVQNIWFMKPRVARTSWTVPQVNTLHTASIVLHLGKRTPV